jgi:hypothetical protein
MNDLLKQLGDIEIQFKLLDAKKILLLRQILEQLKDEPTTSTQDGEAEKATTESHGSQSEGLEGPPIF